MPDQSLREPFPTHPSNRSFYDQMLLWGWEVRKSDGTFVTMRLGSENVKVRAPQTHTGNSRQVFSDVYRITCNGDPSAFWAKSYETPPTPKLVASAPVEPPRPSKKYTLEVSDAEPTPMPEPEPTVPVKPATKRKQRHSHPEYEMVLAVFREIREPITVPEAWALFNSDALTEDRFFRLTYQLRRGGYLRTTTTTLPKKYQYLTSNPPRPGKARKSPTIRPTVEAPSMPESQPEEAPVPAPTNVTPIRPEATDEITSRELLKFILPSDFSALDLLDLGDEVDEWRRVTDALLEKVRAK